jgi:PhoD-like phosphatase
MERACMPPAALRRILTQMRDTGLTNPVVIGGDVHSFWANDLKVDFDDAQGPVVASETSAPRVDGVGYRARRDLRARGDVDGFWPMMKPTEALQRKPQAAPNSAGSPTRPVGFV